MSEQEAKRAILKGELENIARQEYAQEQTARAKRDREAEQEQSQIAVEKLKALGVNENEIDTNAPYVTVNGLKFIGRHRYDPYAKVIHLVQQCKRCGVNMESTEINSLSDLGRLLEQFTEDYPPHRCVSKLPTPKTTEERLVDVLREYITEQIAETQEWR